MSLANAIAILALFTELRQFFLSIWRSLAI